MAEERMTKDYYAILGVPRAADTATIHSAFRARARQYHPDAGTESSTPKFREALEAYHTLSDPGLRRQHDIDLGTPLAQSRVMPEPLFPSHRSRSTSISLMSSHFDEIFTELFRLIESDREFRLRISSIFF
jgi:curved DNA-binding protein CbpA